ncbi:hypothetical protein ACE6H2_019382 [Prunus campanulata]
MEFGMPLKCKSHLLLGFGSATSTRCSLGGFLTTIFGWLLVSLWWLSACYGGAACGCRIVRHIFVNGVRVS